MDMYFIMYTVVEVAFSRRRLQCVSVRIVIYAFSVVSWLFECWNFEQIGFTYRYSFTLYIGSYIRLSNS